MAWTSTSMCFRVATSLVWDNGSKNTSTLLFIFIERRTIQLFLYNDYSDSSVLIDMNMFIWLAIEYIYT